ncbi:hypothetical protein N300_14407, partial [Calypte anna]
MWRRKQEKQKTSGGRVSRQHRLAPCRRAQGGSAHLESLASSSVLSPAPGLGLPGRGTHWTSSPALAGQAPPARVVATTKPREAKAPRVDGHSFSTQDVANSSRGGGSHS